MAAAERLDHRFDFRSHLRLRCNQPLRKITEFSIYFEILILRFAFESNLAASLVVGKC